MAGLTRDRASARTHGSSATSTGSSTSAGRLGRRCCCHPYRIGAVDPQRCTAEAAIAAHILEAGLGEQPGPDAGLGPPELHSRLAPARPHGQGERPLLGPPVGALVDARLALEPA